MNKEELWKRLNEVFRDVFDDKKINVNENTTSEDIEDWDSLEHINLIEAVEQEFSMRFKMKEVSGMKNVGEMAAIQTAQRRSATIVTLSPTLVAKVSEPNFAAIAGRRLRAARGHGACPRLGFFRPHRPPGARQLAR